MTITGYRIQRRLWLRWAAQCKEGKPGDEKVLRWCRRRMAMLRREYYIRTADLLKRIEEMRYTSNLGLM